MSANKTATAKRNASLIHFYLALESIYTGLAIHRLVQWVAWHALPPDCPHCNHRLRPGLPDLPWVSNLRHRRLPYADLFVDDADRYHDEEERSVPDAQFAHTLQPEAVDVRKKDRRMKATSISSGESEGMPTIGMGSMTE